LKDLTPYLPLSPAFGGMEGDKGGEVKTILAYRRSQSHRIKLHFCGVGAGEQNDGGTPTNYYTSDLCLCQID